MSIYAYSSKYRLESKIRLNLILSTRVLEFLVQKKKNSVRDLKKLQIFSGWDQSETGRGRDIITKYF